MTEQTPKPALAKAVERQMRNWELRRAQRLELAPARRPKVQAFITISRAVGSGGAAVARALAERLGWPLFDREILQAMAGDDHIRRQLYESMDERDQGWFEETLNGLTLCTYNPNDYFKRLTAAVLSLARQGNAVFLGRGADLILPQDLGLRVRVVAPRAQCLANLAAELKLEPQAAAAELERVTRERADFIRKHFRVEPTSPERHDLVLNLQRLEVPYAVELIATAARLRKLTSS